MKQTILSILLMVLPMATSAELVRIQWTFYNLNPFNHTAEVTCDPNGSSHYSGDWIIPASITYNGITYSVTSIGPGAFLQCTNLTSISIPNSVTSIGDAAFGACMGLTSISIPESVQSIGEEAFMGCTGLTSMSIPNSLKYLGVGNFIDTPWFENQSDGLIYLSKIAIGYKGEMPANASIIIEDGTRGIAGGAFAGYNNMVTVEIPNGVTFIGNNAFSGCSGLTDICIPNSVTIIGPYAFEGTPWYNNQADGVIYVGKVLYKYKGTMPTNTDIIVENGITCISEGAFSGCSGLTSINIPDGVTSIRNDVFYGCSGLANITIPDGVTSIGYNAFAGCNHLTDITIPDGVLSIGYDAFYGCSGLTSINIPDGIATFDPSIISGCTSLETITLGNGITSIPNNAFKDFSKLTSIVIGENVKSIGDYAFSGCSGLTGISLPNGLTSIGKYAFSGCSGLLSINIPEGIKYINNYTFNGCSVLNNITLPDDLLTIGNSAFYGCSSLTSINIPDDVTSIGTDAFSYCNKLSSVYITDLSAWCNISFDGYGSNPLYYAHHLYLDSQEIKDLVIPGSVTDIGTYTFQEGNGFTSLSIPNHITTIPESAFSGCSGLTSINLPNQLRFIRANAFRNCSCLESITIPASVEYIYQNAFSGCTSLDVINAQPTTPPFLYNNSFSDFTVPVNVPSGCSDAYREAQGWSNFTTFNDGNVYYNLSITTGKHGKATYSNQDLKNTTKVFNVQEGNNATITVTADAGYQIATATINGEDVMSSIVNGILTISNITANKTVEVTFSRTSDHTTVTIGSAGMATYCPMDDVDFSTVSGLKAYTATGYDHGTLTVSRVLNAPAGTGLLLQGDAGTYNVPYATTTGYYINLLHGLMEDTQVSPTQGGYTNFILGDKSGVVSFYRLSEAGVVAAGKAYLQLPTSVVDDVASGSRVMRIVAEDETTGIRSVELLTNKVGMKSEELFDLQGRRVANPSKGIYIVGGQKVVVR